MDCMSLLKAGDVVLFQGDSITDCGRFTDEEQLGQGYVRMIVKTLQALYPEQEITCYNRGISGNRVVDLQSRWQKDCLDLQPTWVSVLIGINDVWRRYDSNEPTAVEAFKASYHHILQQVKDKLAANLIIIEPFVLPVPEDRKTWRVDLDPKIQAVRELAREFGAIYIPTDGLFAEASMQEPPAHWAEDGVHPTAAGHRLIAKAWLKAMQVI